MYRQLHHSTFDQVHMTSLVDMLAFTCLVKHDIRLACTTRYYGRAELTTFNSIRGEVDIKCDKALGFRAIRNQNVSRIILER